jgi:MFS family permease
VFALAAYPLGALADKIGIKKVFLSGLLLFALVYFLFANAPSVAIIYTAFVLYGIYAAATEGITKAWITNLSHCENTATAIGFYTSCESICALFASVLAGWIWGVFGSGVTFSVTAGMALLVFIYFLFIIRSARQKTAVANS